MTSRVWLHVSWVDLPGYGRVGANGLVVVGDKKALLLDTPWTDDQTAVLFDWAERSLPVPLNWVVPSHSHDDCAGGLEGAHRRRARSVAHALTRELLMDQSRAAPGQTFTNHFSIDLGKLPEEAVVVPGHGSPGNRADVTHTLRLLEEAGFN